MRGAGLESAVGDSWPATPAKHSYRSPASSTAASGSRSWSRASLLPRCWRLRGEQHHGKDCRHEQRPNAASGTDSHDHHSTTDDDNLAEWYHAAAADSGAGAMPHQQARSRA